MKEYIQSQGANIAYYITNHPIYELCMRADMMKEPIRLMRWWDQDLTQEEEGEGESKGAERIVGLHGGMCSLK